MENALGIIVDRFNAKEIVTKNHLGVIFSMVLTSKIRTFDIVNITMIMEKIVEKERQTDKGQVEAGEG